MVVLAGSFARKRMAPDIPNLRSDRRTAKQNLHELGSRKTKRGTKISRRGINLGQTLSTLRRPVEGNTAATGKR